nr:putative ribonuclease H-like domain-containing protein [Tanacetum cinerariifolium]
FAKLINDMRNIKMTMSRLQLNSKFVNNMLPEWGRFMMAVKLNRGLGDSNYDQLYAYLKQHETHAKENKMMMERFSRPTVDPLALLSNGRPNRGQGMNPRGGSAAGYRGAHNRVGNVNQGQARTVKCYNCNDKMLLMQAQENGVALDAEQLLFLAGGHDNTFDDDALTTQTMFMANLSSVDPVTDEAGPSYDSDILSDVPNHELYQDDACVHHKGHVTYDSVQLDYVVDSHVDYTIDSNMILYDQYVKDNEVPVVHSDASSVPTDAFMMIYNDMCESHDQSISNPSRNTVVKNSLTAELATYKEHVELELHSIKLQLASTINHNKSMVEEVSFLKKDFKQKENKYLEDFLDMKSLKEKVEDKLINQDQSLQTVYILCRLRPHYNELNNVAIGYKNPLCLTRAKQIQPALYNGHEIIKDNHTPAIVHNAKDTLEIAEITRKKMNAKMNDPESVTRKRNTPTGLTEGERGFEQTKDCYFKEVIPFFKTLKDNFEGIQKALTKEIKEMKDVFEELEAEVAQYAVDRKHDAIEWKNLLIANDNLIAECLSQEVFSVATNSELNAARFTEIHVANTTVKARCLALEAELANLRDKNNHDNQKELINHFSKLEHYKELYDSIKITRAKYIEQVTNLTTDNVNLKTSVSKDQVKPQVLAREKRAIDVETIIPRLRNNKDAHLDYLRHLKESVETIRDIVDEAMIVKPLDRSILAYIPLIRKKQVTVAKPSDKSDSTTHRHVVTAKSQQTNVLVPLSTGVNSCPNARGSQPKSHVKPNRISPAKGVNKLPVEDQPRTNKSHLRTLNRVDSSSRLKRTVINSNSDSICQTCNKYLTSFSPDMCEATYLRSIVATPYIRHNCNVGRKMKQVWKPKQVRQVWKPTGRVLTTIGYQWRPTGRILNLGKQCPLTRFTLPKVVSAKQNKKRASCSKHMTGDRSWLMNFVKKFIRTVGFGNDHFGAIMGYGDYVIACQLGKSKKHTYKPKAENTNLKVLHTLHMDLCGSMRVQTINGKKYILVIVDDYSQFTWVKFLRSKDETLDVVIKFIIQIQVGLNKTVRYVRTDNGTEFVNHTMTEYYERIGIFYQKTVPITPQQNGVVERQNRTLIEAARIMLIFSKASMFLWAEAVATTCYTKN